jgi:hypothetical protein
MVEGLDCFPAGRRVENKASSLARIDDLDPKFILASAVPEPVDDDPVVLAVSEVMSRN